MSTRDWPGSGGHRWSGWPGAYCLDCGTESVVELCVATCPNAWQDCPDGPCEACCHTGALPAECPDHREPPCPAVGRGEP